MPDILTNPSVILENTGSTGKYIFLKNYQTLGVSYYNAVMLDIGNDELGLISFSPKKITEGWLKKHTLVWENGNVAFNLPSGTFSKGQTGQAHPNGVNSITSPSDKDVKYSLTDHPAIKTAREQLKTIEPNLDGLAKLLHIPAHLIQTRVSPQIRDIFNEWLSPTYFQTERNPLKKIFYDTGTVRQQERVKITEAFYRGGPVTYDNVHDAHSKLDKAEKSPLTIT